MNYDLTFYEDNGWATIRELNKHWKYKDVINTIYRDKYSQKDCIGECVNLFEELKPISPQDFRDKLESYNEEHQDLTLRHRGPTNVELFETAKKFREDCCKARASLKQYDVMFYYNNLLHHQTTETFYGCKKEEFFSNYLKLNGLKTRHSTSDEDGTYCVDLFILNDEGKEVGAIQIKPKSFLFGNRGKLPLDRNKLLPAMETLKNDMGIELSFAVYNLEINKWLKNAKNDDFIFGFHDLFEDNNGNVIGKDCFKSIKASSWCNLPH